MIQTCEQAIERCAYWQRVLRLQDWDVAVSMERRHALKRGVANAEIDIYRRAKIRLLDPVDIAPDDWAQDQDLEISIVHELLHLAFHDVGRPKDDSPEDVALERAIEATANALVRLDRQAA